MNLLWTVSNWKRTGPVEPSLDLAAAAAGLGHAVRVAGGRPARGAAAETDEARRARGLADAGTGARLSKHAFLPRDLLDRRRLAAWMRRERPDAVVTTLANDHRLALAAAARAGRPPVWRLWFSDGEAVPAPRERRALLASSGVVVFGDAPRRRLEGLGVEADRVLLLDPPLDLGRLRGLAAAGQCPRARHGIGEETFLVGIVARLQPHRRFDLLWDAVARLVERTVPFHLLVVGRGTREASVAREPVRARGLAAHVTFAGYLRGEAYAAALAALDAQVLLVPGSDPTCRALREGMALGVPSVATRRGLLPTIVAHRETGLLVEETPEALARAVESLARDPEMARRLGRAARRRAESRYGPERGARSLVEAIAARGSAS